ncbi:unnamed protein product [Calypogeia fissa]
MDYSIFKLLDGLQRHLQMDVPSTSGAASSADLAPSPPKKPTLAETLLSTTPEQILSGVTQINDHVFEVYKPAEGDPAVELVFFHGLQVEGCREAYHLTTWLSRDKSELWLNWISANFPCVRILVISYDAQARKTNTDGLTDMYVVGENLIHCLTGEEALVGQSRCPVVLVGHCLGGLVVKEVCLKASSMLTGNPSSKRLTNFLNNIKGLFYYGTPHHGTMMADITKRISKGPLFELLSTLNKETERRNEEFRKLRGTYKWKTFGIGEALKTKVGNYKAMVVEEASSRYDVDDHYTDPTADHFTLPRAASVKMCTYLRLRDFVTGLVTEDEAPGLKDTTNKQDLIPSPLPFGPDDNYVRIDGTVAEVMQALENGRVVTVWGPPGMGKTALVKYIALLFERQRAQAVSYNSNLFPDGIYYLDCGSGAQRSVRELQEELYYNLVVASIAERDSSGPGTFKMKLGSWLSKKKALIILDNLWEMTVLQEFLTPAKGVKYLITSQIRDIWPGAKRIKMKPPTMAEGRQILARFTDGLPSKQELPDNILSVADDIIEKLEYHPLSVVNFGIGVNGSLAMTRSQWVTLRDNLYVLVDDVQNWPIYDSPYHSSVSASMMLMVNSLDREPCQLLDLVAMIDEQEVPRELVKYFYRLLRTSGYDYLRHEKVLEGKSLIELRHSRKGLILAAHGLRMRYIREKRASELGSIASQIVGASSDQARTQLIRIGHAEEETLRIILSARYFHPSFTGGLATRLELQIKIINNVVIPRELYDDSRERYLHKIIRHRSDEIGALIGLLDTDHGDGGWRLEAREHAKKIIIRLICQRQLDDDSISRLLELKETIPVACQLLTTVFWNQFVSKFIKFFFFPVLGMIEALFTVLRDKKGLSLVINYKHEFTLFVAWVQLQFRVSHVSCNLGVSFKRGTRLGRVVQLMIHAPGLLETLATLLLSANDHEVQVTAGHTIMGLCFWEIAALRVAAIPNILRMLFDLFLSQDAHPATQSSAGAILDALACIPEERRRFREVEGGLVGLRDILHKMEGAWRGTGEESLRCELENRACLAARILGELALDTELRKTIASLPGVQKGLLFWQVIEMSKSGIMELTIFGGSRWGSDCYSTRALTIIYVNSEDARLACSPALERLPGVFCSDQFSSSKEMAAHEEEVYATVYWVRAVAHVEVGAYEEALADLEVASPHLDRFLLAGHGRYSTLPLEDDNPRLIRELCLRHSYWKRRSLRTPRNWLTDDEATYKLRQFRVFLKAMSGDYKGALLGANENVEDTEMGWDCLLKANALVERGVVRRLSNDWRGALEDFNKAMKNICNGRTHRASFDEWINQGAFSVLMAVYNILKHGGYVMYLMEDEAQALLLAKSAQKLKLQLTQKLGYPGYPEETKDFTSVFQLRRLPVNYLGFAL